jgi:hypothetical protein
MKKTLLEKCLERDRSAFVKLCRIGIEHPHLAVKVLTLLEKMATMPEDAADIQVFVAKMELGGRRKANTSF